MRLTNKELKERFGFYPIWVGNSGWVANTATDKLGQLEDIEEELGIDLITLFKALKNGIYWKGITCFDTEGIFFEDDPQLDIKNKTLNKITFMKNRDYVDFKDYGKTWSLDKEELL